MDPLQFSTLYTRHHPLGDLHSALPNAPVVPPADRPERVGRARRRLGAGLHRLADAVAPPAGRPAAQSH